MCDGARERHRTHATHAKSVREANERIRSLERASACEHAPWRAVHECSHLACGLIMLACLLGKRPAQRTSRV